MALAFIGPAPSPIHHAAHEDGDGWNNVIDNIAWKTPAANLQDRFRHGTASIGEAHGNAKLTDIEVRAIRSDRGLGEAALAARYGVSAVNIGYILRGQAWKHLL